MVVCAGFSDASGITLKCQICEEEFLGCQGLFLGSFSRQFEWAKEPGGPNKDILGVGSIAFLVRRTLFEAMSRFQTDFD